VIYRWGSPIACVLLSFGGCHNGGDLRLIELDVGDKVLATQTFEISPALVSAGGESTDTKVLFSETTLIVIAELADGALIKAEEERLDSFTMIGGSEERDEAIGRVLEATRLDGDSWARVHISGEAGSSVAEDLQATEHPLEHDLLQTQVLEPGHSIVLDSPQVARHLGLDPEKTRGSGTMIVSSIDSRVAHLAVELSASGSFPAEPNTAVFELTGTLSVEEGLVASRFTGSTTLSSREGDQIIRISGPVTITSDHRACDSSCEQKTRTDIEAKWSRNAEPPAKSRVERSSREKPSRLPKRSEVREWRLLILGGIAALWFVHKLLKR
jgi:hypothetical protein